MKREYKVYKPRFHQREATPQGKLVANPVRYYASCECVIPPQPPGKWQERTLHSVAEDTHSEAWLSLEAYIREVAGSGADELNPLAGIGPEKWMQITTLPPSIATLKSVKVLELYGSHLVRIPPEIGEMTNLREFDPYTSYHLHWFPYEITRCKKLKRSRVSTRALYGNYKYRPPFPRLPCPAARPIPASCSLCRGLFATGGSYQRWISLRVGQDVLPLLVNACSLECIENLPQPAEGYVPEPHQGGLEIQQPTTDP